MTRSREGGRQAARIQGGTGPRPESASVPWQPETPAGDTRDTGRRPGARTRRRRLRAPHSRAVPPTTAATTPTQARRRSRPAAWQPAAAGAGHGPRAGRGPAEGVDEGGLGGEARAVGPAVAALDARGGGGGGDGGGAAAAEGVGVGGVGRARVDEAVQVAARRGEYLGGVQGGWGGGG